MTLDPVDALEPHIRRVSEARSLLEEAIRRRDEAIRAVIASGVSAYRVAKVTGLGESYVSRIRRAG